MAFQDKVVVVGGGSVGALAALYAARRGYQVELYELRDPIGNPDPGSTLAQIPLTISKRGIRAMEGAKVPGLTNDVLDRSFPVHSRMVHSRDKYGDLKETSTPYNPNGECLHIMQRTYIGQRLLLALLKEPNAQVFFAHKVLACNLRRKTVTFEDLKWQPQDGKPSKVDNGPAVAEDKASRRNTVTYNFMIGADGAHSAVRQQLMRESNIDYEQSYVDALWCDFVIAPDREGHHKLDPAYLHVWPDKERVFIVQPDVGGSSRGGMVAPGAEFARLKEHPEEIETFFQSSYPGVIPSRMSAASVREQFLRKEHLSLISIKCGQFGYEDSCVLLGDSSHTMPPFYGMGMNTGLEDVRIFFEEFLDPAHREASTKTFCPKGVIQAYTEYRKPDVQSMTDIARRHLNELKRGIPSRAIAARYQIESGLQKYFPTLDYVPMYSWIVFGHERVSVAQRKDYYQRILFSIVFTGLCTVPTLALIAQMIG